MTLSLGAIGLYIFFELWGHVRTDAANYGLWNAIETGWQYQIIDKFSGLWSGNSFDPLKVTLLPQSYWHLLHTIDLYHSNVSLDGTTFVDLILQSVPGFICDWLGFERPLNGAWRLAQYRIHGGGMYVIAEGYWNFGLLGSSIVALGLAFLVRYLETWYRKQEILIACTYFAFLGSFGFGVFYGLQPLVRAFQVALVSALIMKYIIRNYRIKQTLSYTRTRGVNFISALNRWYGDSDGI
jgi:hypothetical protein